jgi:hypothetical protein
MRSTFPSPCVPNGRQADNLKQERGIRMKSVRACVVFLAAVVLTATLSEPVSACDHEKASPDTQKDNSLRSGAWALQFAIGSNFTLSSFQGALISVKKHLSPRSALRLGVSAVFGSNDATSNQTTNGSDILPSELTRTEDYNQQGIQAGLQYLFYPAPAADAHLFFGFGPFGQFSHTTDNYTDVRLPPDPDETIRTLRGTTDSWGLGLSGLAGVEWFATRCISLHAEYGASLSYSHIRRTRDLADTGYVTSGANGLTETDKAWRFAARYVQFGLSVYF